MKIGSINSSQSFGKVIIEEVKQSKAQKKIIRNILKNKNLTKNLVKDLEKQNTDIYIRPLENGETVNLKLLTDIDFFGMKVTPYESKLNTKLDVFLNPNIIGDLHTKIAISNFFMRAKNVDINSKKNAKLIEDAITYPQKKKIY